VPGLTLALLLLVVVVVLITSGALVGPSRPRSGPEAWITREEQPL
jgi:hypothetical protein